MAARRIQAAARGFLARRRVAQMRRPRLMSPMLIDKMRTPKRYQKKQDPSAPARVGTYPKARIGSMLGTAKSKRTVRKKLDPLKITEHIDVQTYAHQNDVCYFGFKDAGDPESQLNIGCYAVAQMIFKRCGMEMTSIDSTNTDPEGLSGFARKNVRLRGVTFTMQYAKHAADPLYRQVTILYDYTIDTIRVFGVNIANELRSQRDDGYLPVNMHIRADTASGETDEFLQSYSCDSMMMEYSALAKYKWQNVTPASGGGDDVNDINSNPLTGKVYTYKGPFPKLKSAVSTEYNRIGTTDTRSQLHGIMDPQGEKVDTMCFRQGATYSGDLLPGFNQPYKSNQVFSNTLTEDKLYMPPGGFKQAMRRTTKTMNFKRFVIACTVLSNSDAVWVNSYDRVPPIGNCTIIGLEPTLRQSTAEVVKIAINTEFWLSAKCRYKRTNTCVRENTALVTFTPFAA